MSEREEVIDEFAGTMECCRVCLCGNENKAVKDMADEIVRLRSQLAAVKVDRPFADELTAESLLHHCTDLRAQLATAERERDEARKCLAVEEEENAVSEALLAQALRERDEARRERDMTQQLHEENVGAIMDAVCALVSADVVPKGSKSLGDAVKGATSAIAALRHRAERAERVVEAVKGIERWRIEEAIRECVHEWTRAETGYEGWYDRQAAYDKATAKIGEMIVRALDAAEGAPRA